MSASFLNLASAPGAGAQAAGGQGIAQQATQAAQAKGPLAGFEALLAAFFGDQGLTPPVGQATATAALLGGQTAPKTNGKGDGAGGKGSKDCASPDAAATDATGGSCDPTDASGLAVDGALPLIAPTIPLDAAAAATAGNATDDDAGDTAPTGLSGGAAHAQARLLQLAAAAGDKGKAAIALTQAAANKTPDAASQDTLAQGALAQETPPQAGTAADPPGPQHPTLPAAADFGQATAAAAHAGEDHPTPPGAAVSAQAKEDGPAQGAFDM